MKIRLQGLLPTFLYNKLYTKRQDEHCVLRFDQELNERFELSAAMHILGRMKIHPPLQPPIHPLTISGRPAFCHTADT